MDDLKQKRLLDIEAEKNDKPVECLGMTFPNDKERRIFFIDKLRERLKDP